MTAERAMTVKIAVENFIAAGGVLLGWREREL